MLVRPIRLPSFVAPPAALPPERRRALVALMDRRLRERLGAKIGRFAAIWLTAAYSLALLVTHRAGRPELLDAIVVAGLGALSWLAAGPVALAAAGDLQSADRRDGVVALAAQRGYSPDILRLARFGAAMRRLRSVTLFPALVISAVALGLSTSIRVLGGRLLLCAGAAAYVLVLSVVLGVLARALATLSQGHARAWLVGIVLVPHALHLVWPEVASLPSAFVWLLDRLPRPGGWE